jgi:Acyl-coenzyme A:6-aminopenicillanic acid acyl-transferase
MSYKRVTKAYTIDLSLREEERWQEVIRGEGRVTKALFKEVREQIGPVARLAGRPFAAAYERAGGRYVREMRSWCETLGFSMGDMTLMQCSYELSQLFHLPGVLKQKARKNIFGCTAGIRRGRNGRMHHVRTMDWPLDRGAGATRLFVFRRGRRRFVTVGLTGMVGVLSGMLPKAYSATINWAAPDGLPSMQRLGVLFLLRETFEQCDSYNEAVHMLKKSPVATNVFFVVCGAKRGQACVIERTRGTARVRYFDGAPLVQANHYMTKDFRGLNAVIDEEDEDGGTIHEFSRHRSDSLACRLAASPSVGALDRYAKVLGYYPVGNENTVHRMVFCPASGNFAVWARKS